MGEDSSFVTFLSCHPYWGRAFSDIAYKESPKLL